MKKKKPGHSTSEIGQTTCAIAVSFMMGVAAMVAFKHWISFPLRVMSFVTSALSLLTSQLELIEVWFQALLGPESPCPSKGV